MGGSNSFVLRKLPNQFHEYIKFLLKQLLCLKIDEVPNQQLVLLSEMSYQQEGGSQDYFFDDSVVNMIMSKKSSIIYSIFDDQQCSSENSDQELFLTKLSKKLLAEITHFITIKNNKMHKDYE